MPLTVHQIMDILPHRYPFLMIDRVSELDEEHIVAHKNVSFNEPQFNGHFPGDPVMPGVLMVEAMAQAGGLLAHHCGHFHSGQVDARQRYHLAGEFFRRDRIGCLFGRIFDVLAMIVPAQVLVELTRGRFRKLMDRVELRAHCGLGRPFAGKQARRE